MDGAIILRRIFVFQLYLKKIQITSIEIFSLFPLFAYLLFAEMILVCKGFSLESNIIQRLSLFATWSRCFLFSLVFVAEFQTNIFQNQNTNTYIKISSNLSFCNSFKRHILYGFRFIVMISPS